MGFRRLYKMQARVLVNNPGMTWTPPINVYWDGRNFFTDFDVSTFAVPGAGKTYYASMNGSDSSDGLTLATAFKSIYKAANQPDADIVLVDPSIMFTKDFGLAGVSLNSRNVSIKSLDPSKKVIISGHNSGYVWTKTAGMNNTYQYNRTSIFNVFDAKFLDRYGDYQQLVKRNSIAEVDANPGSYYTDGTIVYVRTSDSRVPDDNVRVYLNIDTCSLDNAGKVYLENIHFEGGLGLLITGSATVTSGFYAKNCSAKYGMYRAGGFTARGTNEAFLQDCVAARNENDGFNYHSYTYTTPAVTIIPKVIEVNCVGRHDGVTGDNDNGSTIHDGGSILRLNGVYFENVGPNVADVDNGTQAWNLGCVAFKSKASAAGQNADFMTSTGTAESWFDGCIAYGSVYGLSIGNATNKGNVRNGRFETEYIIGTKTTY